MSDLSREPPTAIRRQLRKEVGFGCPVPGCGSPYLTWHHFDPPWHERHHHEAAGMVALCRDHHPEADAGAFTVDQLREFKRRGRDSGTPVSAQINWMRDQLVAVVGGTFFYECTTVVMVQGVPAVWFGRDEQGNVLVNLQQITVSGELRMLMIENFWITEGTAEHDIECPPSGRLVKASYSNGDRLRVEFQSHASWDDFERRFPQPKLGKMLKFPDWMPEERRERYRKSADAPRTPLRETAAQLGLRLPVTTAEIEMTIAGTGIKIGPKAMTAGPSLISGGWFSGSPRDGLRISGRGTAMTAGPRLISERWMSGADVAIRLEPGGGWTEVR
jgi:hypothetical protein